MVDVNISDKNDSREKSTSENFYDIDNQYNIIKRMQGSTNID